MIEFPVPNRSRTPARLLILLLGILTIGSSGCALHPGRWLPKNDSIVFSNADWTAPKGNINSETVRVETNEFPVTQELTTDPEPAVLQGNDGGQGTFRLDRKSATPDFEGIVSPTDTIEFDMSTLGESSSRERPSMFEVLRSDQFHFYSRQNVRPALRTLGSAAILANTTMDQEFADWYQDDVRSKSLDEIADVAKIFGEQWPMVGAYLGASMGGRLVGDDTRLALWGDRSLRSMFVGVPPLLLLQKALGSSRPNDRPPSSNWGFWADSNGASGHAFVGAVPFLVAAEIAEDRRAKTAWIALSTLTGWSRINDNDHYLSQVIVGWWLAYAATQSVERSDANLNYEITPFISGDSPGMEFIWRR